MSGEKETNPKDAIGSRKVPMSVLPARVLMEVGIAMLEGAVKYGRFNYRALGTRASVYYDAAMGHLMDWYEGEDIDAESGVSHITKAITSLMVLRDSMMEGNWTDDRPPRSKLLKRDFNPLAGAMIDKHADKSPHHYTEAEKSVVHKLPKTVRQIIEKEIQPGGLLYAGDGRSLPNPPTAPFAQGGPLIPHKPSGAGSAEMVEVPTLAPMTTPVPAARNVNLTRTQYTVDYRIHKATPIPDVTPEALSNPQLKYLTGPLSVLVINPITKQEYWVKIEKYHTFTVETIRRIWEVSPLPMGITLSFEVRAK